jgi:hypothetical protein
MRNLFSISISRTYRLASVLCLAAMVFTAVGVKAEIAATHIYHNHMPNFWAYYDLGAYAATPVGQPVRYAYDGQVINLKKSPPAGYSYFLPSGAPMPHDDLVSYYSHHAKTGAYLYWPWQTADANRANHPLSQTHVTMSGAVVNNTHSLNELQNVPGYNNLNWGEPWRNSYNNTKTTNGQRALDLIHFTGHHSMGPMVGNDYLEKDLIFHNATLAQPYFIGSAYKSSKGFFPTELGFSSRMIPTLKKFGIEWSVLGNVHYSRTLRDYPYLNDPGIDTLTSPPNRADLQNDSNVGSWVSLNMFNEKQVTQNKFPFAAIPHWVRHLDPETGQEYRVAGIPVEQAGSWEEGYQGSVTAAAIKPFESIAAGLNRKQFFVVAHDGDNSSGRAGDGGTWLNSGRVTYSDSGVRGMGVDEYLRAHPIPNDDVVHVQDGSWIDTRDSSADPTWYHWHIPMGIWKGQFADFNRVNGTSYAPKKNLDGVEEGHTVSMEYGYHYLERNFALLQAALNYAKTAEQIWLGDHLNHWAPTTSLDKEITYPGNQLNPWMISFPVKGDAARDYAGGANPAELAWYFLLPAMDSGFGYYDENVDDHVKPTLAFNQSLAFAEPYVQANLAKDKTGPSVWWPQRYPYNPGSANVSKAEGWTLQHFDNTFSVYSYAFDVSGISSIKVRVRPHTNKQANAKDNTFRVYDPVGLKAKGVANIDPARVGAWVDYPMTKRALQTEINGVGWQTANSAAMKTVSAKKIGDMYYVYLNTYRDQIVDYYIEATDAKGNVSKSDIQQVYVGAGKFRRVGGKVVEDVNGDIVGTYPFVTDKAPTRVVNLYVESSATQVAAQIQASGQAWGGVVNLAKSAIPGYVYGVLTYNSDVTQAMLRYNENGGAWKAAIQVTPGTWTITAAGTASPSLPACNGCSATVYYKSPWAGVTPYIHYRPVGGAWTLAPGVKMNVADVTGYHMFAVPLGGASQLEAVFNNGASLWDNNGGKNYLFPVGISTLNGGVISSGKPSNVVTNIAPIARAGADFEIKVGQTANFDGSASIDSDGSIVTYSWSNGVTGAKVSKVYDQVGVYNVTLTVTDDKGATATDTVVVTVSAASGSLLKSVYPTMYFRGTPNGFGTTAMTLVADYTWQADVVFGAAANERFKFDAKGDWTQNFGDTDKNGIADSFGADIPVLQGAGAYQIRFNDQTLGYQITKAIIDNPNKPPVAKAGADILTKVGRSVTLDGSTSSDSDGSIVSYHWSNGVAGAKANTTFASPGIISITLTVTDDKGATATDEVLVYVLSNQEPIAEAGPDVSVSVGAVVNFSATGSFDPDGAVKLYGWGNGASTATTSQKYDQAGTYTMKLIVTDDDGGTEWDEVTIQVTGQARAAVFPSLYVRGTHNSWGTTTPMTLIADNTWQADVNFVLGSGDVFKFDVKGDWTQNYGDNNGDGVSDANGANIAITKGAGLYRITYNDKTHAFTASKQGFSAVYASMYLRGTHNNWAIDTPMKLVADNTWQVDVTFGNTTQERFKFDVKGDWSVNFGDANKDGAAESNAADIYITQGFGNYRIVFNDQSKAYTITKQVTPQIAAVTIGAEDVLGADDYVGVGDENMDNVSTTANEDEKVGGGSFDIWLLIVMIQFIAHAVYRTRAGSSTRWQM